MMVGEFSYDIRTFVNVTMYLQYSNKIKTAYFHQKTTFRRVKNRRHLQYIYSTKNFYSAYIKNHGKSIKKTSRVLIRGKRLKREHTQMTNLWNTVQHH
jgi:hypothetical protein